METGTEHGLAAAIGGRVKERRQRRGWTLDELADASGVSRRTLVNVEQGSANPSVGTLLRISGALGVSLPALVEPPADEPVRTVRNGDGAVLWEGDAGGRGTLLVATAGPEVVELWDWTLGVGDRHDSHPHPAGTREVIRVWAGTVEVTVGAGSVRLHAGDAATFSADVAHAYANGASDEARFSLVVYEPTAGATSRVGRDRG